MVWYSAFLAVMYRLRVKFATPEQKQDDSEKRLSELPMMLPSRRPSVPDTASDIPRSPTVRYPAKTPHIPPRQFSQGPSSAQVLTPQPGVRTPTHRVTGTRSCEHQHTHTHSEALDRPWCAVGGIRTRQNSTIDALPRSLHRRGLSKQDLRMGIIMALML